jgi:hypothetical protein
MRFAAVQADCSTVRRSVFSPQGTPYRGDSKQKTRPASITPKRNRECVIPAISDPCGSRKPRRPAGSTQQGPVVMSGNEPTPCGCSDGSIRRPGGRPLPGWRAGVAKAGWRSSWWIRSGCGDKHSFGRGRRAVKRLDGPTAEEPQAPSAVAIAIGLSNLTLHARTARIGEFGQAAEKAAGGKRRHGSSSTTGRLPLHAYFPCLHQSQFFSDPGIAAQAPCSAGASRLTGGGGHARLHQIPPAAWNAWVVIPERGVLEHGEHIALVVRVRPRVDRRERTRGQEAPTGGAVLP